LWTAKVQDFLLIFPRQSGKNEAVAHLLVYLLNLLQRSGGAIGDGGKGNGPPACRLEERLDNNLNRGLWRKGTVPLRHVLDKASVIFLSSHPGAHARGETAHWLLVVDELLQRGVINLDQGRAAVIGPRDALEGLRF